VKPRCGTRARQFLLRSDGQSRSEGVDFTGSSRRFKRSEARKRPSGSVECPRQSEITRGFFFRVTTSTVFSHFINRFSTGIHGLHGFHGR
jgi:hypothetical protein